MNYAKDLRIDETALDLEWLDQPSLMLKYGQLLAQFKKDLDWAKEAVDATRAQMDKKIRTNPEKYGVDKVTETAVQNAIVTQPEVIAANGALIQARYEMEMCRVAVEAIQHRRDALENLVRLYGQQYFAGPRMPRDVSTERERREAQVTADQKVAQAMRRK